MPKLKVRVSIEDGLKMRDVAAMKTKGLAIETYKGLKKTGRSYSDMVEDETADSAGLNQDSDKLKSRSKVEAKREVSNLQVKTAPARHRLQVKAEEKIFSKSQMKPLEARTAFSPLLSRRQKYNRAYELQKRRYVHNIVMQARLAAEKKAASNAAARKVANSTAVRKIGTYVEKAGENKIIQQTTRVFRRIIQAAVEAVKIIMAVGGVVFAIPVLVACLLVAAFPGLHNSLDIAGSGMFVSPFGETDYVITSAFGYRIDPVTGEEAYHAGWDVVAVTGEGSPVFAVADGYISAAVPGTSGYGNFVILEPDVGENMIVLYGHLQDFVVEVGQTVETGELIGFMGNTGKSTGPHLHFEVRIDNEAVDGSIFWDLVPGATNGSAYMTDP